MISRDTFVEATKKVVVAGKVLEEDALPSDGGDWAKVAGLGMSTAIPAIAAQAAFDVHAADLVVYVSALPRLTEIPADKLARPGGIQDVARRCAYVMPGETMAAAPPPPPPPPVPI